jgi:hypothetical protein
LASQAASAAAEIAGSFEAGKQLAASASVACELTIARLSSRVQSFAGAPAMMPS